MFLSRLLKILIKLKAFIKTNQCFYFLLNISKSATFKFPHIVDVSWRLDYLMKVLYEIFKVNLLKFQTKDFRELSICLKIFKIAFVNFENETKLFH